jgi:hypothetical protein
MPDEVRRGLREALKTVAVALKEIEVPFALAGSYGLWARGGPEPEHDVDFLVAEDDAPRVMERLAEHGLQVVQPPEDWLFKVFVGGSVDAAGGPAPAMVDILFRTAGVPVTRRHFEGVSEIEVESVAMPVLSATTLMIDRMLAMEEHACNLSAALPAARAVREQIDWSRVREAVADNPYGSAFLYLLDRLSITG